MAKADRAEQLRIWRRANPDKVREQSRRQRRNDPERDKRWRAANVESARAAERRWRMANKDKRNAITATRRARLMAALVPLTTEDQLAVVVQYAKARSLTELTGEPYHVDHVVPLARGGLHHPANLQVLPGRANQRKGARV